jgi:hypothetical protein
MSIKLKLPSYRETIEDGFVDLPVRNVKENFLLLFNLDADMKQVPKTDIPRVILYIQCKIKGFPENRN